jgi:hypothetical protein
MDEENVVCIHKKNEILPLTTIKIELQIILSSEISQDQKDKCHMISPICGILKS